MNLERKGKRLAFIMDDLEASESSYHVRISVGRTPKYMYNVIALIGLRLDLGNNAGTN